MNAVTLCGGSSVGAGAYREVHSGHLVYLGMAGRLPGQINSERYVKVPDQLYMEQQVQRLRRERASA